MAANLTVAENYLTACNFYFIVTHTINPKKRYISIYTPMRDAFQEIIKYVILFVSQ